MKLKVECEVIVPDGDHDAFPQFWKAFVKSFEGTDIRPVNNATVTIVEENLIQSDREPAFNVDVLIHNDPVVYAAWRILCMKGLEKAVATETIKEMYDNDLEINRRGNFSGHSVQA